MSDVGRDGVSHVINPIVRLAAHQGLTNKRVAQIVNAWMTAYFATIT